MPTKKKNAGTRHFAIDGTTTMKRNLLICATSGVKNVRLGRRSKSPLFLLVLVLAPLQRRGSRRRRKRRRRDELLPSPLTTVFKPHRRQRVCLGSLPNDERGFKSLA